jgi:hypothetical protein
MFERWRQENFSSTRGGVANGHSGGRTTRHPPRSTTRARRANPEPTEKERLLRPRGSRSRARKRPSAKLRGTTRRRAVLRATAFKNAAMLRRSAEAAEVRGCACGTPCAAHMMTHAPAAYSPRMLGGRGPTEACRREASA